MSARIRLKMNSNAFLVTQKVFLNLASLYGVAQTTSHHPEFLDKRLQLRKRTLSSSTDCNNKRSSKQDATERTLRRRGCGTD